MHIAGRLTGWRNDAKICPQRPRLEGYNITTVLPPVVNKPDDMVFPFCIARGEDLENTTKRNTTQMTDTAGLVRCNNDTWYPLTNNGSDTNTTATIKLCQTSQKACIKCEQVLANGAHAIYEKNSFHIAQYRVLDFTNGTAPLGDIFWICERNAALLSQLPENWTGICAPLMLTGQLSLIVPINQTPLK